MHRDFKQLLLTPITLCSFLIAWLIIGFIQTIHFHFYFDQPWLRSFFWAYRDWFFWIVTAMVFFVVSSQTLYKYTNKFKASILLSIAAVIAGLIQIFMIILTDFIFTEISRPFWEDFLHLYQKRWFQNLLIYLAFMVFFHHLFGKYLSQHNIPEKPDISKVNNKIKVSDGKKVHWLSIDEIFRLEVTGNYVCYITSEGQIITRNTMKAVSNELDGCGFIKVNRSNLVNSSHIKSVDKNEVGFSVKLANGDSCQISRRMWKQFKSFFDLH